MGAEGAYILALPAEVCRFRVDCGKPREIGCGTLAVRSAQRAEIRGDVHDPRERPSAEHRRWLVRDRRFGWRSPNRPRPPLRHLGCKKNCRPAQCAEIFHDVTREVIRCGGIL